MCAIEDLLLNIVKMNSEISASTKQRFEHRNEMVNHRDFMQKPPNSHQKDRLARCGAGISLYYSLPFPRLIVDTYDKQIIYGKRQDTKQHHNA